MTEDEFRTKYPHSTDEQVRLYGEAVAAEKAGYTPTVEKSLSDSDRDIPMPMVTVPERPITTYASGVRWFGSSLGYKRPLDDVPPEVGPADTTVEMRAILLGRYGLNLGLSPGMRQRLQTTDMTEEEMLAMLVGAPSAREFGKLA